MSMINGQGDLVGFLLQDFMRSLHPIVQFWVCFDLANTRQMLTKSTRNCASFKMHGKSNPIQNEMIDGQWHSFR
jgi:hypothetical protein